MATQHNPSLPQPTSGAPCHDDTPTQRPDAMVPPSGRQGFPGEWRGDPAWSAEWDASAEATPPAIGRPGSATDGLAPATPRPDADAAADQATITAAPPAPSPTLGIIAFVVVTTMTLACLAFAYLLGGDMGNLLIDFGGSSYDPAQVLRSTPVLSRDVSVRVVLGFLAAVLGCGGWIMSIVAYNRRSARSLSLAAIIVGLIVPMLALIALLMAAGPYVHQIPR